MDNDKNAVDQTAIRKTPNPDTTLRTDHQKDSLYSDGLDIEDNSETYADTHANKMPG